MRVLTREEEIVLNHLGSAWDDFIKLDPLHPEEFQEFRSKVHDLQRMVASRPFLQVKHDT